MLLLGQKKDLETRGIEIGGSEVDSAGPGGKYYPRREIGLVDFQHLDPFDVFLVGT